MLKMTLLCLLSSVVAAQGNLFDEAVMASAANHSQWTKVTPVVNASATARAKTWSCVLDDTAYFLGGESLPDEVVMGDFWKLDFPTLVFTEVTTVGPRPSAREKTRLVCDKARGVAYLVGGKKHEDLWAYHPVNNTWRLLPGDTVNGLSSAVFSTDFIPMSTTDHIILAGTDNGDFSDYAIFDKRTETWLPKGYDSRLRVEDPGGFGYKDIAVFAGGVFAGAALPNRTYSLNMSQPNPVWEDLVLDGMAGEEFRMEYLLNDTMFLLGDPGGKGVLATGNNIAFLDLSQPKPLHWTTVRTTGNPGDWVPNIGDFMTNSYHGKLILMGGLITTGSEVTINTDIYVFNPAVCPSNCNNRGKCVMGNCMECAGHSGVMCEIPDPTEVDLTPLIIGASVGGFILLLVIAGVTWKATAKSRAYRKLFDTNTLAEEMAAQIATMDLDGLDYLVELTNPSKVQQSFILIIKTLKTYKMYLPESVLQSVQNKEESEDDASSEGDGRSKQSRPSRHSKYAVEQSDSGTLRSRLTSIKSRNQNHKVIAAAHMQAELVTRLTKRNVATASIEMAEFSRFVETNGMGNPEKVHSVIGGFADIVHTIAGARKGTLLHAQLADGMIVVAWNFLVVKSTCEQTAVDACLEIVDRCKSQSVLDVYAGVTSFISYAGNLGGTHLRVPALVGPHRRVLDAILSVGQAKKARVVTTHDKLFDNFSMVPLDIVVSYSSVSGTGHLYTPNNAPSAGHKVSWVFEVLCRLDDTNEEWMYQLEAIKSRSADICKILATYERTGPAEAITMVEEVKTRCTEAERANLQRLEDSLISQ
eukprot:TRINITY_DN4154_c0_g2_i1.p1 TRINITY_DN4154_c0_g2~~TRINITY_DN4154_c0_g2_i1.p1  ORF type:complete len:812 (+),score=200.07 TRINITY_DN4154_c0_g2_i1:48-2483(+)